MDAVEAFRSENQESFTEFISCNHLKDKPIIALLAGSRKQEIKDNLIRMMEAAKMFPNYQFVVAGAPGIEPLFYQSYMNEDAEIVFGQTYRLLPAGLNFCTGDTGNFTAGCLLLYGCRTACFIFTPTYSESKIYIFSQSD